ncbi:MAG TPA: hypothetical protein VMV49_10525 [Candidatus Deferrimicrobium sp.]|nr:hypothetical protein [Candidatus Deferrimicrobium sp.]
MNSNSKLNEIKNSIYKCTNQFLKIEVSDVPIEYVNDLEFFRYLKSNSHLSPEYFEIEDVNLFYRMSCEITPGIYKYREKKVIIKTENKFDSCLLLTELIHSKSITQFYQVTEKWIKEGLPHYIAKVICKKCKFSYRDSTHKEFFPLWEFIHKKHGFDVLITILYPIDIKFTKKTLKLIFNYNKEDILEITFEKAQDLLFNQN